ncbi:SDR family oxidoreductase [Citrobacter sp. JGM124]|uniref:SDR family oxidoreductase n=1 Tax=Citrobacter sp. JGM124 TaxID=2799789 RepID=UPI001BA5F28B|nr:SDR family oxidoreductase [Citrobacter sp. JGM124]MBS0849878.1 SDR family oxidoreductase [Citrobacter sp. JGM124]
MTPWLIFGAGGKGVGLLTALQALEASQSVIALVRKEDAAQFLRAKGATVLVGDACDEAVVSQACQLAGPGATIISTMGGSQDYLAHRTVINCAEQAGISRMILVTSLGCGDSWAYLSPRYRAAFGQAVREKSLAESWLQTSSLEFTILRPGGLLNGPPTGKAQLFQEDDVHGLVMRADVATEVVKQANSPSLNHQIYSVVEPGLKPA